jgi:hypothetical protein
MSTDTMRPSIIRLSNDSKLLRIEDVHTEILKVSFPEAPEPLAPI